MGKIFRPMLAAPVDFSLLRYPVVGSAKLDGIRAVVVDGRLVSRTNKPIANRLIQKLFAGLPEGVDGELIVGNPYDKDVYRRTNSVVMSHYAEPTDVQFFAFDLAFEPGGFSRRYSALTRVTQAFDRVLPLPQILLGSEKAVLEFEENYLRAGYEGIMLRQPDAPYKNNRSTAREGYLLKLKRFNDAEATIVGFEELLVNANEATYDERGYTTRSSHQENLVRAGHLGALVVQDTLGREFKIGTGFTLSERVEIWNNRAANLNRVVKFKHLAYGEKDLPRHPVFLGFRDEFTGHLIVSNNPKEEPSCPPQPQHQP